MTVPIKIGDKIVIGSKNAALERELDSKYQRTKPGGLEWDTTKPVVPPEPMPTPLPPEKPKPVGNRDLREDEKLKKFAKKKKGKGDK